MPLFGSRKHHDTAADNVRRDEGLTGNSTGFSTGSGPTAVNSTGHHNAATSLGRNDGPYAGSGAGGGLDNTGQHHGYNEPGYNNNFDKNRQHGAGMSTGINEPYSTSGTGHHKNSGNVPPTGTLNTSDQTRSGGGLTGKVEQTVGSIVGSDALKAKGLQREQEANTYKMQSRELAEAERLEQEALLRRERAVGHGAHPDNKHLGAGLRGSGNAGAGPGTYN